MARMPPDKDAQGGRAATLALILPALVLLLGGGAEFAHLLQGQDRAVNLTHQLAGMALEPLPGCSADGWCPAELWERQCPEGAARPASLLELAVDCEGAGSTACRMLEAAQTYLPGIEPGQIEVSYSCSAAGTAEGLDFVPLVTVSLHDTPHTLVLPELLGAEAHITLAGIETTRIGTRYYTRPLE